MPTYTTVTLDSLTAQIGILLDDTSFTYWKEPEIHFGIWEGLRVWGALTSYWRGRGTWSWGPTAVSPWNDLSVVLPLLRPRTVTLDQMVQEIQFMCLENPSGIAGTGMSGQISVTSILQSISRGRNRFVLDAHLPLSINSVLVNPPPPQGMVQLPQTSVFVHRAGWQDLPGGAWANLWRSDAWAIDKGDPTWTITPGMPLKYSEAENAPLQIQIVPPPANEGVLEALTVDSLQMNLADPLALFGIPDEWVHAVKYAALSDLFSAESQNTDPVRFTYAEQRYQQAILFAKEARSVIRLLRDNLPIAIDSMNAIDAGRPTWRNQVGSPNIAGVLYDMVAFSPGIADRQYGMAADVVQSAPIPVVGADFIPLGVEDIDNLVDYVTHVLTFKCGGKEFTQTLPGYDGFMAAVAARKGVNAAKIKYLSPLFSQAQKEWSERPDRIEVGARA